MSRHGARLDAADTQWHLTSPIPYDPPLTYGGWRQSQALGARIASIIQFREAIADSQSPSAPKRGSEVNGDGEVMDAPNLHPSHRGKRRKHKVVIHSSPFLRCIQTSIAISAGMSQYRGSTQASSHSSPARHAMDSGKPQIQTTDGSRSPHLSAIPEPGVNGTSGKRPIKVAQTLLRIDAFLGEWLSPDYFDKITPPPGSKLMVASAKADLLRRGEPIDTVHPSNRVALTHGLWGSKASANSQANKSDDDTPLSDLSGLRQGLPRIIRANSHSIGDPETKRGSLQIGSRIEKGLTPKSLSYVPPTPSHAVSPSQPIPQGYVAHARDACVKVDYQWDSLRPPLEWGSGGDYGEEWSSMHMRFRKGLQNMISWYRGHRPIELVRTLSEVFPEPSEAPDEDDTDTILVLVTHGAGCNALIGALTNQPVLLDVGMASLTMAVRKTVDYTRVASPSDPNPPTSPSRRRHSIIDSGISDDYEVKLTASTDHLRPGSQFSAGPQLQRSGTLPVREKSPYRYERPGSATTHPSKSRAFDEEDELHSGSDVATPADDLKLSDVKRSASTAAKPSGGGGLWSKPVSVKVAKIIGEHDNPASPQAGHTVHFHIPQLDRASETPTATSHDQTSSSTKSDDYLNSNGLKDSPRNHNLGRSIAPSGLWGTPPHAMGTERDTGPKRRWTLSQAS